MSVSDSAFNYRTAQIDFAAPKKRQKDVRIFINGKANANREFYLTSAEKSEGKPTFKTDAEGYLQIRALPSAASDQKSMIYKPMKMSSRYGFTYKDRLPKTDLPQKERLSRTFKDITVGAIRGSEYVDVGADPEFIRSLIRKTENGEKISDFSEHAVTKRIQSANDPQAAARDLYIRDNTRRELAKSGDTALRGAFYTGIGGAALIIFAGVSAVSAGTAAPAVIALATPLLLGGTGAEVARARSGVGNDDFIRADKPASDPIIQ